jgi:hypothetical protein
VSSIKWNFFYFLKLVQHSWLKWSLIKTCNSILHKATHNLILAFDSKLHLSKISGFLWFNLCKCDSFSILNYFVFQKLKSLVRPRPASTTPLGKAVFGRSTPKLSNDVIHRDNLRDLMALNQSQIIPNRNRTFLMDTQVMYTVVSSKLSQINSSQSDILVIVVRRKDPTVRLFQ